MATEETPGTAKKTEPKTAKVAKPAKTKKPGKA